MKIERRTLGRIALALAVGALALLIGLPVAQGQAQHGRWDIISVNFPTTTVSPGGVAFASSTDGSSIRLSGAGTFIASAGRSGRSSAVTGGGTWETFNSAGVSTGTGTYVVTELVSFELANFQSPGLIDNIGDTNERANGNALLRIEYSDGERGILGVGCHGPGAPAGIHEGVNATKGFKTYWNVQAPAAGVDANRTIFHVRQ